MIENGAEGEQSRQCHIERAVYVNGVFPPLVVTENLREEKADRAVVAIADRAEIRVVPIWKIDKRGFV